MSLLVPALAIGLVVLAGASTPSSGKTNTQPKPSGDPEVPDNVVVNDFANLITGVSIEYGPNMNELARQTIVTKVLAAARENPELTFNFADQTEAGYSVHGVHNSHVDSMWALTLSEFDDLFDQAIDWARHGDGTTGIAA